jgi:sugar lactone lactonase YvrE
LDGTGAEASFHHPDGVAVDVSGNVYVAELTSGTARMITPAGVVTTLAAGFNRPTGAAVDASGNVYVADTDNITIRKITSAGVVTTFAGTAGVQGLQMGALPGMLNPPKGIAITPTAIYFTMADCVVKIPL